MLRAFSLLVLLSAVTARAESAADALRALLTSADRAIVSAPPVAAADFRLRWEGEAIEGVTWGLDERSLEWIRSGTVAYPRARVRLHVTGSRRGMVSYAGIHFPLAAENATDGFADVAVVLLSGIEPLRVMVERENGRHESSLRVEYAPAGPADSRVYLDPTCLPYEVSLTPDTALATRAEWIYLGCHLENVPTRAGRKAGLRLTVLWDGPREPLQVDGLSAPAVGPATWMLELAKPITELRLARSERGWTVRQRIPEFRRQGNLGLGLGPYAYRFRGGGEDISSTLPVPTLYFWGDLADWVRVVGFDTTVVGRNVQTDAGVYLKILYAKAFDDRLIFNLMLGGHAVGFTAANRFFFLPDLAQGTELVLNGLPTRSTTLTIGGFVYPDIKGVYYYNLWLRLSWQNLFIELNHIDWKKSPENAEFLSTTTGISVGFPLWDL